MLPLHGRFMMTACFIAATMFFPHAATPVLSDAEIDLMQRKTADEPIGERISFWAEQFIGTPYDQDVLGEYVRRKVIVADERVDCMYLTFRVVELAIGKDPADAIKIALEKRFIHQGMMDSGKVINYEERFRYAEDMLESGKWGREITHELRGAEVTRGSRGRGRIVIVPKREIKQNVDFLKNGDIVFFVPRPSKKVSDENVSHIGIISRGGGRVYLIHASGTKHAGGRVKKVVFLDYVNRMPFIGIKVSRFETDKTVPE